MLLSLKKGNAAAHCHLQDYSVQQDYAGPPSTEVYFYSPTACDDANEIAIRSGLVQEYMEPVSNRRG